MRKSIVKKVLTETSRSIDHLYCYWWKEENLEICSTVRWKNGSRKLSQLLYRFVLESTSCREGLSGRTFNLELSLTLFMATVVIMRSPNTLSLCMQPMTSLFNGPLTLPMNRNTYHHQRLGRREQILSSQFVQNLLFKWEEKTKTKFKL